MFHKYDLKTKSFNKILNWNSFYEPTLGPVLIDGVEPCFNCHWKSAVGSCDHPEQRIPGSKLQSNGDCGAMVVRSVVVVDSGGAVVVVVGTASFNGRIEQLLVVNVKSSIEISP